MTSVNTSSGVAVSADTSCDCSIRRSVSVENTTPSSPSVVTSVPAGTTTASSGTADSQKVMRAMAAEAANGLTPTRLRKSTYIRSGTWFRRNSTCSDIHAKISIRATPGSERL